jgi:vitamin B12 transporter
MRGRLATLALIALSASSPAVAQVSPTDRDARAIVVTGTTVPVAREEIGDSNTVIDGDAIERGKSAYLQDVLRDVPGLGVNQAGSFGAQTQVRIRGAEANHVLVLVDGIDVSAVSTGEFDFSSLLANDIERVEVLRGPQSGLYGSNALAGVINVITRGGQGPRLDGGAEYGSFDTRFARASVRLGGRETFLTASGIYRQSDGISSAAIGTEPDGDRNLTGYVRAAARLGSWGRIDGALRVVDKHTQTDGFDFSGGPLQGLAVDDDSYADTRDRSGGGAVTLMPAEHWQGMFSAAYSAGRTIGGFGTTPGFGDRASRLKLTARSTVDFATPGFAGAMHTLTGFAEYKRERYRNTFPFDPSQVARQERGLFGFGAEYRLGLFDSLFLSAAVRHDDNDDFRNDTSLSLAGSWVIRSAGTRVHASYGTGVTNPTFYEQFGFVPGQFVGNPALRPEKAVGWDFGVEQRLLGDRLVLDATWFRSDLTDEIVSLFPSVANDAGRSKREGVELSGQLTVGAVSINAGYSYLHATDPDGSAEVRRPRHQASLDLAGRFGPRGRGSFSARLIYNGRMLDDDFRDYFRNGFMSQKTPLAAYTVARVAVSYQVNDAVELFGRVENAFDERYQQAISYASPGRAVYAGARFTLP